jgi:hypothetical protein
MHVREIFMPGKESKATTRRGQARKDSKVSGARISTLADAPVGNLRLQQGEPPDVFVTGGSRSLQRRCLGLNLPVVPAMVEKQKKRPAAKANQAVARSA